MIYLILIIASVVSFVFGFFYYGGALMRMDKSKFVQYIFLRDKLRKKSGLSPFRDHVGLFCKCGKCPMEEIK